MTTAAAVSFPDAFHLYVVHLWHCDSMDRHVFQNGLMSIEWRIFRFDHIPRGSRVNIIGDEVYKHTCNIGFLD